MSTSIKDLPPEVIERIIERASETPAGWTSRDVNLITGLSTLSKSWLHPARRVLYRDIHVRFAGQALLLFDVLKHTNPELGKLVRTLDSEAIFGEGPSKGLAALLDTMPLLAHLSVYPHQMRRLSRQPRWNALQHLRLHPSGNFDNLDDSDDQYDSDGLDPPIHTRELEYREALFPKGLASLTLVRNAAIVSPNRPMSGITLESLDTLILEGTHLTPLHESIPTEGRLLPRMPNLRTVYASNSCPGPGSEATLIRLIQETSSTLRHLRLEHNQRGANLISYALLPDLKHLEVLEFSGIVQVWNKTDLVRILPPSLRWFDIKWHGSVDFGIQLLESLENDLFLPNLEACPRLTYEPWMGNVHGVPLDHARVALEAACKAYNKLMKRKSFKSSIGFRLPTLYHDLSRTVPCLPFPLAWRSSLSIPIGQILDDLVINGEVSIEVLS